MTTMLNDISEKMNLKDLEETLANSTPLLAVVGAGDLAVEKLRAAREGLTGKATSVDPQALRDQAQTAVVTGIGAVQAEVATAPERLRALPEKAQEWPAKAQDLPAKAQSMLADVLATAFSTYGELAGRGKSVVDAVRASRPVEVVVEKTAPVTRPSGTSASTTTSSTTHASSPSKSASKTSTRKASASKSSSTKAAATKAAATKAPAAKASAGKRASTTSSSGTGSTKKTTAAKKSTPAKKTDTSTTK